MAIRNYVGARYVPKFADPVEWQSNTSYEAMVIVTYNNASYTSKVPVPPTVGNPAENSNYWALTGNYNAQVEEYRQETADIKTKVNTNTNSINNLTTALSGKIQYKVYTTIRRKNVETNTTNNVSGAFNQSHPEQFVEAIPSDATLIPISLRYHYFATNDEYNDSDNKGHELLSCTVRIDPAMVINGKTVFNWLVQNQETWTEVGYYIEYGVLEIK